MTSDEVGESLRKLSERGTLPSTSRSLWFS